MWPPSVATAVSRDARVLSGEGRSAWCGDAINASQAEQSSKTIAARVEAPGWELLLFLTLQTAAKEQECISHRRKGRIELKVCRGTVRRRCRSARRDGESECHWTQMRYRKCGTIEKPY